MPHRGIQWATMSCTFVTNPALALIVGATLILGTGPTGLSAERQGPDPCTILSATEINAILVKPVIKSKGFVTGGDPACMWYDAENLDTVQIILYRKGDLYDISKSMAGSTPLAGVGTEAHISKFAVVQVKTARRSFFVQSSVGVKDGQIGAEVRAAVKKATADDLSQYEAGFRLAKLIVSKL